MGMGSADLIDTGQAIEIFCDDLGSIDINGTTVCFNGYRLKGGERVINLTVIVPLAAIPNIAAMIAASFAETLVHDTRERLLGLFH